MGAICIHGHFTRVYVFLVTNAAIGYCHCEVSFVKVSEDSSVLTSCQAIFLHKVSSCYVASVVLSLLPILY